MRRGEGGGKPLFSLRWSHQDILLFYLHLVICWFYLIWMMYKNCSPWSLSKWHTYFVFTWSSNNSFQLYIKCIWNAKPKYCSLNFLCATNIFEFPTYTIITYIPWYHKLHLSFVLQFLICNVLSKYLDILYIWK